MLTLKNFNLARLKPSCKAGFFAFIKAAFIVLFIFNITDLAGQGNLLITPRRIVFEGNKRSFDLNLANTGEDSAVYAINIVQIRMNEDGAFETITEPDPGQQFADRFVRFFPRQVTLAPKESQVVKLQLIRNNELKPGEYRSHIYFRAIPKPKPLGENDRVKDSTAFSVQLTPIFGITIPVIIRVGSYDMKVSLSDLSFDPTGGSGPAVKITFNRTGNMSVYGDITVDHISPAGKITRIGIASGVAVYTPNQTRKFVLNLNIPDGVDTKSGKLRITYSAPSDVKPEKYAEAELVLR
jgi:uncharacterized membrane protein